MDPPETPKYTSVLIGGGGKQCLSSTWHKSMAMTCNKWPKPTRHTATVAKNLFRWTARIVYLVFHVSWWTTFVSLTWGNRLPNDIKQSKKTIKTVDRPEGTNSTSCLRRFWNMKAASCCPKVPTDTVRRVIQSTGMPGMGFCPVSRTDRVKLIQVNEKSCSHWSRDALKSLWWNPHLFTRLHQVSVQRKGA